MGTSSRRITGSQLTGLQEYQQKVKISIKKYICHRTTKAHLHSKHENEVPVWDSSLKKNQYSSQLKCSLLFSTSFALGQTRLLIIFLNLFWAFLPPYFTLCCFLHLECPLISSPIVPFWNLTHSAHCKNYFFLEAFPVIKRKVYFLGWMIQEAISTFGIYQLEAELKALKD